MYIENMGVAWGRGSSSLISMEAERVTPSTGAHPGLRTPLSARPDPGIDGRHVHPDLQIL